MKNPLLHKVFPLLAAGLLLLALTALYAAQTAPPGPERPHPAIGQVDSVDAKAKTFVLQPGGPGFREQHRGVAPDSPEITQGREPLVVNASKAKIYAEVKGTLADCAVGKWVRVMSPPAREGVEGAVVMIVVLPEAPPALQKLDGTGPGPGPAAAERGMGRRPRGHGFMGGLVGQIVKLEPFTIKSKDGKERELTISEQTRFMKTVAAAWSDLLPGKRVMVTGDKSEAGALAATRIMVMPERKIVREGFVPRGPQAWEAPPPQGLHSPPSE